MGVKHTFMMNHYQIVNTFQIYSIMYRRYHLPSLIEVVEWGPAYRAFGREIPKLAKTIRKEKYGFTSYVRLPYALLFYKLLREAQFPFRTKRTPKNVCYTDRRKFGMGNRTQPCQKSLHVTPATRGEIQGPQTTVLRRAD